MKEDQRAIERPTQFDDTCSQVTGDVARSAIIPSEGPLTADPPSFGDVLPPKGCFSVKFLLTAH